MITTLGITLSIAYGVGVGYGLAVGVSLYLLGVMIMPSFKVSNARACQWFMRCLVWPVRLPLMVRRYRRDFRRK